MIDKRTKIGKMIDNDKVVYICLKCSRRQVGDANINVHYCGRCKHADEKNILLVIEGNLVVRK